MEVAKGSGVLGPPRRLINAILMLAKAHLQDAEGNHPRTVNSLIGKSGVTAPPSAAEGRRHVCDECTVRPRLVESRATKPSVRQFHAAQILAG